MIALDVFYLKIPGHFYAAVTIVFFAILAIGSSLIQLNLHLKSHSNPKTFPENSVALTFDDGPSENTSKILEILKKHSAKATFFCIGKNVLQFPEITKQIIADGHILGNHSYSHSNIFGFFRKIGAIEELKRTDDIIYKVVGKKVRYFRPPFGVTNPSIAAAIKETKHEVIGWNIRSMDGVISNEKKILDNILKKLRPGAIILLHDTKPHTNNVLEQLLLIVAQRKLKCATIEQMLEIPAYEN